MPAKDTSNALASQSDARPDPLREQADRYRTYVANAPLAMLVTDASGRYVEVNPAACRISGYSEGELLTMSFTDLLTAESAEAGRQYFASVKETGYASGEVGWIRKDGVRRWCAFDAVKLSEERLLGYYFDITERVQAENALQQSDRAKQAIIDSLPAHIAVLNAAGRIIKINAAWIRFAQAQRPGELSSCDLGVDYLKVCRVAAASGDAVAAAALAGIQAILQGERERFALEYPCHTPQKERWFAMDVVPLRDGTGGAVVTHLEITERKAIEEALRKSEQQQKAILDTILDPAWLKDHTGRCLAMNPACCRLIGREVHEVVGKTDFELLPADAAQRVTDHDRAVMQARRTLQFEEVFRDTNGNWAWFETVKNPLFNSAGEVVGTSGVGRNITERKRAEAILKAERDLAGSLAAAQSLSEIARLCLDAALVASDLECGGIYLFDSASAGLHVACHSGLSDAFLRCVAEIPPDSLQAKTLQNGQAVEIPRHRMEEFGLQSAVQEGLSLIVAIPVLFGQRPVACLNIASHVATCISPQTRTALEAVAAQMGGALARAQAEELLRQSERRQKAILDTIPDAAWFKDNAGRLLAVNAAWCRFFGLPPETVMGRTTAEILPTELAAKFEQQDRAVKQSKRPTHCEELVTDKTARPFWFETINCPLLDEQGAVQGTVGIARDITERKQAAATMQESEAILRSFFESPGVMRGIVEVVENDILHLSDNGVAAAFFGRTPESMRHRRASEMGVPPDLVRLWLEYYEASRRTDEPVVFEYKHAAGNAETWLRATVSFLATTMEGRPRYVYSVNDITDLKRAQEALRQAQDRLALAADAAQIGLYDWDLQTGTVAWTRQHEILWGYPPTAVAATATVSRNYRDWADRVHPDDLPAIEDWLRRYPAAGTDYQIEHRVVWPDGSLHWIAGQGRAYCDAAGRPTRLLGTVRDITDRKRTEHEKLELQCRLLHAQKLESLGILAGGVAHDFNNILAAILGYANLAKIHLPSVELVRADITVVENAAQRAADLTRQLLAYSGKGKFIIESVSASRVASEACSMLKLAISKKTTLHCNLPADLPAIEADASQLHQVVVNLVMNASEALADNAGLITVTTDVVHCTAADCAAISQGNDLLPGCYVRLTVTDTGCGMDQATLQKIFDPFFTTKFTGRGLGLAAVHGIIRGHKGGFRVASRPGAGTTFQIFFPASHATAAIPLDEATIPAVPGPVSGTVLIVDDEEIVRTLASRIAEHAGFSALTAEDGAVAVELYRQHQAAIVCVLLDLTMPNMNGEETFHALREINPAVRVILSSGYQQEELADRFAQGELAGFIHKPYRLDALINMLRQAAATR